MASTIQADFTIRVSSETPNLEVTIERITLRATAKIEPDDDEDVTRAAQDFRLEPGDVLVDA
jgi:hypothetical protein